MPPAPEQGAISALNAKFSDEVDLKRLSEAVLRRSLRDLEDLVTNQAIDDDNGRPLTAAERGVMMDEVASWFFDSSLDGPFSLAVVCEILALDLEATRAHARHIMNRSAPIKVVRRRLSEHQVVYIRDCLERGESVPEVAKQFRIHEATCRKIRLQYWHEGGKRRSSASGVRRPYPAGTKRPNRSAAGKFAAIDRALELRPNDHHARAESPQTALVI